jgi:hypothetical protein
VSSASAILARTTSPTPGASQWIRDRTNRRCTAEPAEPTEPDRIPIAKARLVGTEGRSTWPESAGITDR